MRSRYVYDLKGFNGNTREREREMLMEEGHVYEIAWTIYVQTTKESSKEQ